LQASRTALVVIFSVARPAVTLNLTDTFVVDDYIVSFASSHSPAEQMMQMKRSSGLERSFQICPGSASETPSVLFVKY
jgi:hypothetical protein